MHTQKEKDTTNIIAVVVEGQIIWLTVRHVAAGSYSCHPAAIVSHGFPLAADVTVNEVGVLTADEQVLEIMTEVLQLHPDKDRQREQGVECIVFS